MRLGNSLAGGSILLVTFSIVCTAASDSRAQSVSIRKDQSATCLSVDRGEVAVLRLTSQGPDQRPARVEALFMEPAQSRPAPAIILMPTAVGVGPPECHRRIQLKLRDWGYASLLIDHASGGAAGERSFETSLYDRIADLAAAVRALSNRPEIGADRLGVIGWSRGALSVLVAFSRRPPGVEDPFSHIRAAALYYPTCPLELTKLPVPTIMFHGEADSAAPVESCRSMKIAEEHAADFELNIFRGAGHFFDHPDADAFHAQAASQSWMTLKSFLKSKLGARS